jgi:hypothetical protein
MMLGRVEGSMWFSLALEDLMAELSCWSRHLEIPKNIN